MSAGRSRAVGRSPAPGPRSAAAPRGGSSESSGPRRRWWCRRWCRQPRPWHRPGVRASVRSTTCPKRFASVALRGASAPAAPKQGSNSKGSAAKRIFFINGFSIGLTTGERSEGFSKPRRQAYDACAPARAGTRCDTPPRIASRQRSNPGGARSERTVTRCAQQHRVAWGCSTASTSPWNCGGRQALRQIGKEVVVGQRDNTRRSPPGLRCRAADRRNGRQNGHGPRDRYAPSARHRRRAASAAERLPSIVGA